MLLIFLFGSVIGNVAYPVSILFREYGEEFPESFYSIPQNVTIRMDTKTQMEYVSRKSAEEDVVITSAHY